METWLFPVQKQDLAVFCTMCLPQCSLSKFSVSVTTPDMSNTCTDNPESMTRRSLVHGIAAIVIMGFYGGQVCPFVDGLNLGGWFFELAAIFGIVLGLRAMVVERFIKKFAASRKVVAQFWFELGVFLLTGVVVSAVNLLLYGFPLESGLKMLFGAAALGFFVATDMGLARERVLAKQASNSVLHVNGESRFYPITRKFAVFAILTAIIVTTTMLLVLVKDLDWILSAPAISPEDMKASVLKEVVYIAIVFLAYIVNLILSYSYNLKRLVDEENRALMAVSEGDLSRPVNVYTNDEFGIMGQYTNHMIQELGESRTQLELANRQLLDSERLRAIGEFASTIVHEVRSPLHVVQLMMDYFEKQTLADSGRKRLKLAQTEVTRLLGLMNEILLYAKPQNLVRERIDLVEALNEWAELFETQPATKHRTIALHLPDQPTWIEADPDKIKQAVLNLVTNACEAAPHGALVQVHLEKKQSSCCLEVRNEGEPIAPEQLQSLTKPFVTTKQGGTGLGLPIVKRIAEAHGGTLSITSSETMGTRVSIEIPASLSVSE